MDRRKIRDACAAAQDSDKRAVRAVSSVGRAPALHAGCRRVESVTAHQDNGRSWVERTWICTGPTSAYDPNRTLQLANLNRYDASLEALGRQCDGASSSRSLAARQRCGRLWRMRSNRDFQ